MEGKTGGLTGKILAKTEFADNKHLFSENTEN
jgi:hypothetical protein